MNQRSTRSLNTLVRAGLICAVSILVVPLTSHAASPTPGPGVDPVTGQVYGPSHPRWSHTFKIGDNAAPHTLVIPMDQSECDAAKRINPKFVQNGPCTTTMTLQEYTAPALTESDGGGSPQSVPGDGKGKGGSRTVPRIFLSQRRLLPHGPLSMRPMWWNCSSSAPNCYYWGLRWGWQGLTWFAQVDSQFGAMYDGNQYSIHGHMISCSADRGGLATTIQPGWCGFYNDGMSGNPSSSVWMESGHDFSVTTCAVVCSNAYHGMRIHTYSDTTYTTYYW